MPRFVLHRSDLDALISVLGEGGREVIGPVARDGAILYAPIRSAAELPEGLAEEQSAGRYRLTDTGTAALFAHTLGPDSPKRYLHPPRLTLFTAKRSGRSFTLQQPPPPPGRALLGVRACDLAAVRIQDRALMERGGDPHYAARRSDLLLVAVQCGQAGGTCFCASMNTGPRLPAAFDLALTEIIDDDGHRFVVEVGSEAGAAIAERLPLHPVGEDHDAPEAAAGRAEAQLTRRMPTEGLRERLLASLESPRWDEVAQTCLGCGSCTMVCPTCFCTTVHDTTDLSGDAERTRIWDSCFNLDFSYVHGGPVRPGLAARYRQWLTHKLATWHDQFDTAGCVGCGRCTTWCPAGIDFIAQAQAAGEEP